MRGNMVKKKPSLLFKFGCLTLAALFATPLSGGMSFVPASSPPPSSEVTGVTNTLLDLIAIHEKTKITADDYQSTSMGQIITLGTPAGYRIKLRYTEFGISLVEALRVAKDEELRKRLVEMAQWSRRPKVRAEAIVTLASLFNPDHLRYFKSALLESDVGIRFAAVEALQMWGLEGTTALLKTRMEADWSPLMKVWAAQALLGLGDRSGLDILYEGLNSESWVIRAMSARYLGDYADPSDYEKLVNKLQLETRNDFVVAELAIASLKLISQKGEKVSYSPFAKGWKENDEVRYTMGRDNVIELEPLIIVPPRLRIPKSLQIAAVINNKLLDLIRNRLDQPLDPIQAQDPMLYQLNSMLTPTGFGLKTRYSQLSYLVTEALGGTTDPFLRMELERMARDSSNPLVRATAMLSLAYNREERDLSIIFDGLSDQNPTARFGAMEAVETGRFQSAIPQIIQIANLDPVPAFRVYAMHILSKFGNPNGRQLLLTSISQPDWPARAMTFWYLGRYGSEDDYSLMITRLPYEDNPFVKAEIALGALRLHPVKE